MGCHGNVNLEPNISLFLALIDPIGIFLYVSGLSHPFLGMGPGPLELGK